MARKRALTFGHFHVCPVCQARRECQRRVPFLECSEDERCAAHWLPAPDPVHRIGCICESCSVTYERERRDPRNP